MLVVRNVDVIEVNEDQCVMFTMDASKIGMNDNLTDNLVVNRENIPGYRFRHPHIAKDIIIGWSQQVQEALVLPFRALEDLSHEVDTKTKLIKSMDASNANLRLILEQKTDETIKLRGELRRYKNMNFIDKIMFLFERKNNE